MYRAVGEIFCDWKQEIWANAHERRHSISSISYAGCLGLSEVYFSENIHSKCAPQPKIAKNHLRPVMGKS